MIKYVAENYIQCTISIKLKNKLNFVLANDTCLCDKSVK